MSTITTIASWDAISASRSVINTNFSNLNADKAELSWAIFTGDVNVPDEVYGSWWNGSTEVPTKNALYDKIETISGGGVSDWDKGDITVSSSGTVWIIDNGAVTEAKQTLSDNTTNDFSTTKHGYVPKWTNVGDFLKDDWTWASIPWGGDALTSNPLSQFASTTSSQLRGVLSDETWTGVAVFNDSPTITSPNITHEVVSSNKTAVNGGEYVVVASATFTDPSPTEWFWFRVVVRNGTATVWGTGYSVAWSEIVRVFHSGAWATYLKTPSSGVNTGDQTSIVGITGTFAQFNTAVTDADLARTDSANTFTGTQTITQIDLGNTDTSITRISAWEAGVEGKRILTTTPLVVSATSYTTDTGTSLNMDNLDIFIITAQAGSLLFNAPGGTLVQGRKLMIRIKDNWTARALTWNAVFRAMWTALPSTTVLSKTLYLWFVYNSTDTKWDLVARAQEA